jgi:predicted permease
MGVLAAVEKLVPVILAFGGGVLFARRGTINTSKAFVDFAFLFAVPCYLFVSLYRADLGLLFTWQAIVGYAATATGGMAVVAAVTWFTTSREPRRIALRIMAALQVNTAYFAVPVFVTLFGTAAPIFPVLLFQVCVLTTVVLAIMELGGPPAGTVRTAPIPVPVRTPGPAPAVVAAPTTPPATQPGVGPKLATAVWASLRTPLVAACNMGILVNLLAINLPTPVTDAFAFVGDAASPAALFALGLHVGSNGLNVRGTTSEEVWLIAAKCVVFPLTMWLTCTYIFGVQGDWLKYLVLIAAMPAPQNLFIFAQRYEVDVDLSASLVVKSSVIALLLLPLWIQWAHAV